MTAKHLADFEISREKGDFLKTEIGNFVLNKGSIILVTLRNKKKPWESNYIGVINNLDKINFPYTN